jgi:hypothetical protein
MAWVPVIIGLWRWRHISPPARIICYYFLFWAVEPVVDLWSRRVLHTNIYLFHVSVLVETLLLGWAYYQVLNLQLVRRIMPWVGVLFTLVALADAFWINGLNQDNTVARVVQVPLVLIMVLLYFEQWIRELHSGSPWRNFMFIVNVALVIYYTSSVVSYLNLGSGGAAAAVMGIIIGLAVLVRLLLMTWALWQEAYPQKQSNWLVVNKT